MLGFISGHDRWVLAGFAPQLLQPFLCPDKSQREVATVLWQSLTVNADPSLTAGMVEHILMAVWMTEESSSSYTSTLSPPFFCLYLSL